MSQGRLLKPLLVSRQAPLVAEQTAAPEVWDPLGCRHLPSPQRLWGSGPVSMWPSVLRPQPCPGVALGWAWRPGCSGMGCHKYQAWQLQPGGVGVEKRGGWAGSRAALAALSSGAGRGLLGLDGRGSEVDAPCVMCGAELESRRQAPCASPGLGWGGSYRLGGSVKLYRPCSKLRAGRALGLNFLICEMGTTTGPTAPCPVGLVSKFGNMRTCR